MNPDGKFLFYSIKRLKFKKKKKKFISKNSPRTQFYFPVLHSFPTKCTTETFPFIVGTLGCSDLKSDNTY